MSWGAVVCSRDNSCNGVGSQQQQVQGQASVAEAEAAQGQTTINQKAVAIAAETVLVAAEMAAAMVVAAAMAMVAMVAAMAAVTAAPTWCGQWQRGWPMWEKVIFRTYYYLCITVGYVWYRCDVISTVRHMAKH